MFIRPSLNTRSAIIQTSLSIPNTNDLTPPKKDSSKQIVFLDLEGFLRQASKPISQFLHFGFEFFVMGASVWKHSTQAGVKLSRARFLHDSCNVGSANP